MRLTAEFYRQDTITVAKELLGKYLVRQVADQQLVCKIVETEAYQGPEDKGSHAYGNRRTKRTETMYQAGGCAYVYLIYGMYYMLNVVTSVVDIPHAVLIRAGEPVAGIDVMKANRTLKNPAVHMLANGPGKLCQAMQVDMTFDGYDLIDGDNIYCTTGEEVDPSDIVAAKRINIDYAEEFRDKPWRFYLQNNRFVSKP